MALLTLSNARAPAHFFHLILAPTMRLPNEKMLLCWPSRMQIYGLVENHKFLEQFDSMGVPGHFPILWLRWPSRMQIYGFVENHTFLEQFDSMGVPGHFSQPCMAPSG